MLTTVEEQAEAAEEYDWWWNMLRREGNRDHKCPKFGNILKIKLQNMWRADFVKHSCHFMAALQPGFAFFRHIHPLVCNQKNDWLKFIVIKNPADLEWQQQVWLLWTHVWSDKRPAGEELFEYIGW